MCYQLDGQSTLGWRQNCWHGVVNLGNTYTAEVKKWDGCRVLHSSGAVERLPYQRTSCFNIAAFTQSTCIRSSKLITTEVMFMGHPVFIYKNIAA